MNQIKDPPNNYPFGTNFNYAVWTPGTHLTFTNVTWNNDYRDVVWYKDTDELNAYINSSASTNLVIDRTLYAKPSEPIMIDTPFNVATKFNYVRVYNPAQPLVVGEKDVAQYFYYFITDVKYVAPNTTAITVQLDLWQTYIRRVQLGRCYIERSHLGIANMDNFRNFGRDYLTVPEGLDLGSNYMVTDRIIREIMALDPIGVTPESGGVFVGSSIIVCATVDLEGDPGTIDKPNLRTSISNVAFGVPSGAAWYLFKSVQDFQNFMWKYRDKPWVTQGIISINIVPDYRRYYRESAIGAQLPFGGYRAPGGSLAMPDIKGKLQDGDFRDRSDLVNYIPPRYRHLKKFWTFPYMAIRMASPSGQQVILQPEFWNSVHGEYRERATFTMPNARVSIYPESYNARVNQEPFRPTQPYGDGLDRAVSVSNFPSVAIVNNQGIMYMAQNARSIAFGFQSADWSQQRALAANQATYDNSAVGTWAGNQLNTVGVNSDIIGTGIANNLAQQSAWTNAIGGTATGAGMGAFAGPAGALAGGIGGAATGVMGLIGQGMQQDASNAQLANRVNSANTARTIGANAEGAIRDTNKGLADWAARGDYSNTIAGMQAKIQDAQLSAPSISGQAGGEILDILHRTMAFRFEFLMPDQANIQAIGEYWLRYGYAIQRFAFVPNNFMVMTKFTYWKMKETYIRAAGMPESFKQAIRGIFEKGVTVWADANEIGLIDTADNKPLPGITIDGYVPPTPDPQPDPEPPVQKKRKKNMILFSSVDDNPSTPGDVWALAGTSPGTSANWLETRDAARAVAYQKQLLVDGPVGIPIAEFRSLKLQYLSPVETIPAPTEPAP